MSESETSKDADQERDTDSPIYLHQVDRRYVGWDEFSRLTETES
jgi:hypothetical protein